MDGIMHEATLMDIKQVASYLQINEATAYSWAQEGEPPGIKIGRIWRFRRKDIKAWLDASVLGSRPPSGDSPKQTRGQTIMWQQSQDCLRLAKTISVRKSQIGESGVARWPVELPASLYESER